MSIRSGSIRDLKRGHIDRFRRADSVPGSRRKSNGNYTTSSKITGEGEKERTIWTSFPRFDERKPNSRLEIPDELFGKDKRLNLSADVCQIPTSELMELPIAGLRFKSVSFFGNRNLTDEVVLQTGYFDGAGKKRATINLSGTNVSSDAVLKLKRRYPTYNFIHEKLSIVPTESKEMDKRRERPKSERNPALKDLHIQRVPPNYRKNPKKAG